MYAADASSCEFPLAIVRTAIMLMGAVMRNENWINTNDRNLIWRWSTSITPRNDILAVPGTNVYFSDLLPGSENDFLTLKRRCFTHLSIVRESMVCSHIVCLSHLSATNRYSRYLSRCDSKLAPTDHKRLLRLIFILLQNLKFNKKIIKISLFVFYLSRRQNTL